MKFIYVFTKHKTWYDIESTLDSQPFPNTWWITPIHIESAIKTEQNAYIWNALYPIYMTRGPVWNASVKLSLQHHTQPRIWQQLPFSIWDTIQQATPLYFSLDALHDKSLQRITNLSADIRWSWNTGGDIKEKIFNGRFHVANKQWMRDTWWL